MIAVVAALLLSPSVAHTQDTSPLPPTRADALLEEGRWAEAEALYYQQSERAPRDPVARAALGRFLAMKGAVRPGMVLIEEAQKFGLPSSSARQLLIPLRAILDWRAMATDLGRDSTLAMRESSRPDVLFQIALPRVGGEPAPRGGVSEVIWHDVVDRAIGVDSVSRRGRPIGLEVFEGLMPSVNVGDHELTLHAHPGAALSATGRRYQVLRTMSGVRVLMGDRRVSSLADALRDIDPKWWQIDLVHGILVVRR